MSAWDQMEGLRGDLNESYAAVAEMGGTVPEGGGSVNLPLAIRSIPVNGVPSEGDTTFYAVVSVKNNTDHDVFFASVIVNNTTKERDIGELIRIVPGKGKGLPICNRNIWVFSSYPTTITIHSKYDDEPTVTEVTSDLGVTGRIISISKDATPSSAYIIVIENEESTDEEDHA